MSQQYTRQKDVHTEKHTDLYGLGLILQLYVIVWLVAILLFTESSIQVCGVVKRCL